MTTQIKARIYLISQIIAQTRPKCISRVQLNCFFLPMDRSIEPFSSINEKRLVNMYRIIENSLMQKMFHSIFIFIMVTEHIDHWDL